MKKLLIVLISALFLFSSCGKEEVIKESRIAMGTVVTLTFYSKQDSQVIDDAFSALYQLERDISFHNDSSYISKINENAGKEAVEVPEYVFELIKRSIKLSRETDSLFNPLMGAVTSLWNIGSENARRPTDEEIANAITLLDVDDIILNEEESTVFLKKSGMKLDLGAIGKGYTTEVLKALYKERGIENALINLGGNVYAMGTKPDGSSYKIGIANPDGGAYLTTLYLKDEAVVTSGAYERYSVLDGIKYQHIFSSSGYPSDSDLLSATLVNEDATLADALSTAAFIAGSAGAEELSKRFGVEIITYSKDRELRFYEP